MNRIIAILICGLFFIYGADAKLEIIKGQKKLPTLMIDFFNNNDKVAKLLAKDLEISGNFRVLTQSKKYEKTLDFLPYQVKQIDLVAYVVPKGAFVELELFDINAKKSILKKIFALEKPKYFPMVAHKIANAINDYFQAPSIHWMEKMVVFSKLLAPSKTAIVVADYTLTYQEDIIDDGLNIFPKWADENQTSIFFTKYLDRPTIIKYDLVNKKFTKLLSSQGMAIVSDVSSDFKRLLVSMSPVSQADIYLYHLDTKKLNQLTNYPGIDVGANFIENQKRIIFVSDRLGYPNIFYMNETGGNVEQAVFQGRNNSSVTSNGDYIVYSSREEKNEFGTSIFNLYMIGQDGTAIRRLTINGANQMPRFSKDGENIMFLKNTNKQSALGIIRLRYNKSYLFPIAKMKIQSFDW